MLRTIDCFCDGSYNNKYNVGVAGWMMGSDNHIYHESVENPTSCYHVELYGTIRLLRNIITHSENSDEDYLYVIHTDSQSMINRLSKREKIISKNYRSNSGKYLPNHETLQELFETIDGLGENIHLNIKHIEGHKKKNLKTYIDRKFSRVDKKARSVVREIVDRKKKVFV